MPEHRDLLRQALSAQTSPKSGKESRKARSASRRASRNASRDASPSTNGADSSAVNSRRGSRQPSRAVSPLGDRQIAPSAILGDLRRSQKDGYDVDGSGSSLEATELSSLGSEDEDAEAMAADRTFTSLLITAGLHKDTDDWMSSEEKQQVLRHCDRDAYVGVVGSLVNSLLDTGKRNRKHGRGNLANRLHMLYFLVRSEYLPELFEDQSTAPSLLRTLLRHAKSSDDSHLAYYALCAFEAVLATASAGLELSEVLSTLQEVMSESESEYAKAAACDCVGLFCVLEELSEDDISEAETLFLEIITGGGAYGDIQSHPMLLMSAIHAYGELITTIEDYSDDSKMVADEVILHLSSYSPGVAIAAAEFVALLFEKSYTAREQGDRWVRSMGIEGHEDSGENTGDAYYLPDHKFPSLVRRYHPFSRKDQLEHKLSELATSKWHQIPKRFRKNVAGAMYAALKTLHNPMNGTGDRDYLGRSNEGSRNDLGLSKSIFMRLDRDAETRVHIATWQRLFRVHRVRKVLKNDGMLIHYCEQNPRLMELVEDDADDDLTVNRGTFKLKVSGPEKYMGIRIGGSKADLELPGVDYGY